jgi:hypothetical protein
MPWDSKHDQWKYFSRYWQDEGKEAFEAYIKKSQEQGPEARNER